MTSSPGGKRSYLGGGLRFSGLHHDGNMLYFSCPGTIYFFEGPKRAQNDGFGSKSSSRKRSEVRLGPEWVGHLRRCCGRANAGQGVINHNEYHSGNVPKTLIWAHLGLLGLLGPLETKPGNGMIGVKAVYGILEQVVQRAQK